GVIELYAETEIILDGTLVADGAEALSTTGAGGAGSGGTVVLYSGKVTVGDSAVISTDGGAQSPGSYYGGYGADGRVKIVYGNTNASDVSNSATIVGQYAESVAPPWVLSSSTHPDENAWYNDGFNTAQFAWQRPSYYAVNGYYWIFNQTEYGVPTTLTGTFNDTESLEQSYTSAWNNKGNYIHLISMDSGNNAGTVEHTYRIQVNSNPPNVVSSSHPNEATFYAAPNVAMTWTDPRPTENFVE